MAGTQRREILDLLREGPRSVSALAALLGLRRSDAADHLEHALRSARAAGARIVVTPASCKTCGFVFDADRLVKPGRCPSCRGSRIFEPQISLEL